MFFALKFGWYSLFLNFLSLTASGQEQYGIPTLLKTSSHVSLLVSSCSTCVLFWWVFATSVDTDSFVAFAEWNDHRGSNRSSTRAGQNAGWGSCTLYQLTQKIDRASNQQPWWFANSGKFSVCPVTNYGDVMFFMKFFFLFYFFCRSKLRSWKMKSQKRNHIYIC